MSDKTVNINLDDFKQKFADHKASIETVVEEKIKEGSTKSIEEVEKLNLEVENLTKAIKDIEENQKAQMSAHMPGLKDELKKKEFNFGLFVKAAYNQRFSGNGLEECWKEAGHEREIINEYAKARGKIVTKGSIAGDGTQGGYLIPDEVSSELVGLTIAQMPIMQMGTTNITGLKGDLPIPRLTARNTAYWLGETQAPDLSEVAFDMFTLRPKKIGALSWISNRLQHQTSGVINGIVKNAMIESLQLGIHDGFLQGTGSDAQPRGILNQTGTTTTPNQSANAVRFRIDKAASMEQALDVANELIDGGNFGYIMRPEVRGGMKRERVVQFTGQPIGQGQPIGGAVDTLLSNEQLEQRLGYKLRTTTQLSNSLTRGTSSTASKVIFGNWKHLYTAFWRGMEIKVSDAATVGSVSAFARDLMFIMAIQEVDSNVGRATAFTIVEDAETNESNWTNG